MSHITSARAPGWSLFLGEQTIETQRAPRSVFVGELAHIDRSDVRFAIR